MEIFYSQWTSEEENLLRDLSSVPTNRPDLHIPLISRTLSHFAVYSDRLIQHADQDIFLALSGYWLTPFERVFFWFGGLKPHIFFGFTPSDITEDQRREIDTLKQKSAHRVTQLEAMIREMEEIMAAFAVMRTLHGNPKNGEFRAEKESMVNSIMHTIFQEADKLRKHVVSRELKVLTTEQAVQFLASVINHQILTRQFGLHHIARF